METYVVAVKRECRDTAPDNWRELVGRIEGAKIVGDANTRAIRVTGSDGIGYRLRKELGHFCHVEEVILHDAS